MITNHSWETSASNMGSLNMVRLIKYVLIKFMMKIITRHSWISECLIYFTSCSEHWSRPSDAILVRHGSLNNDPHTTLKLCSNHCWSTWWSNVTSLTLCNLFWAILKPIQTWSNFVSAFLVNCGMAHMVKPEICSNQLQCNLIIFLFNFVCELGWMMIRYDFLPRRAMLTKVCTYMYTSLTYFYFCSTLHVNCGK